MVLPPKNEESSLKGDADDRQNDESVHHRTEAKAYAFLSLWIFADFLVIFGHVSLAVWVIYFVLVMALGLFTHHATNGWATKKKIFTWTYVCACVTLPIILFALSRPVKSGESNALVKAAGYSPISSNDVALIIQKLRQPHPPVGVLVHAFNPDESEYELSEQLKKIFIAGGYAIFDAPPPSGAEEIPGVGCFLYGCSTCGNEGILEALQIILDRTGSHQTLSFPVSDVDPWFTNSVVVITIRKK